MAKLLFKLNSVPDDEADDIREILTQADIDFYETSSGMLGLSFAAIWLKEESEYPQASEIINKYQEQRLIQARANRQTLIANNEHIPYWQSLLATPFRVIGVVIFVLIVTYLTVSPFFPTLFSGD